MRNIFPSTSKSDVILLDMGRDFSFRDLFLVLLLPSPDLDLDLGLDALGASTDSNLSLSFSSLLHGTNAGSSSEMLYDLF